MHSALYSIETGATQPGDTNMATTRIATSFKNIGNITYVVEVHDSEFNGTATKYIAGGDGFNITYEGEDAMNAPIISSQVTLPILMQGEYRTVINDLITDIANNGDENRFTVVIFADSVLYWRGKIQAERINIPDQYTALITLQANDGFGRLKDIPYDNAGTLYEGAQSFRGHIYNILSKLDLWSYGGIDNMFNVAINYKVADIPLQRLFENLRFDHDAVKDIKQDGTILPLSCYDVLIQILTVMHCRIVQQAGVFFIQNIRYLADSGTKSYGRYDNDGNWIETIPAATFDTTIVQKLAGGSSFFRAPASTVTMQYSYKDALNGGNLFLGLTPITTNVNLGDIPTGNGEQVVFDLQFDVKHTGFSGSSMIFYIKFTFRIYSGTYYLSNSTGEMAWTANSAARVNIVSHYEIDDALSLREIWPIQIVVPELPAPGTLNYYWDWAPSDYIGNSVTPLGATAVATAANSASIIYAIGEANEGTIVTTASGGNTSGEKIELPTVVIGDLPFLRSVGRIQYQAGGVWYNTENVWGYGVNESLWIDQLVTRDTLALQRTATRINSYILKQSFPGCASKIGGDVVMRAEFIANAGQWTIEAFTPSIDTDGITWIDYVESGQTGGLPGGITPTPPAPTPNFWKRTGTELTPATANDNVKIVTTAAGVRAIYAESTYSTGVYAKSLNSNAIHADASIAAAIKGSSPAGGADLTATTGIGLIARASTGLAGYFEVRNTSGNSIQTVISLFRDSSATATAGIGSAIDFNNKQSAPTGTTQGRIINLSTNTNIASVTSDFIWQLRNAGAALAEVMRLTGAGKLTVKIGDFKKINTAAVLFTAASGGSSTSEGDNIAAYICDTTSGDCTINLNPATTNPGREITFRNYAGTNDVLIVPNGSESIRGSSGSYATLTLTEGQWVKLQPVYSSSTYEWFVTMSNPTF